MLRVVANGDEVEVADGATVHDLLEQLGLGRRLIVVERNGEPVPKRELETTKLADGDRLELVRAVAGG
jgi:sulfur carrier protein